MRSFSATRLHGLTSTISAAPIMPTDVVIYDLQSLIVPLHVEMKSLLLALIKDVLDALNSLTTVTAVCYACLFHAIGLKRSYVKAVVLSSNGKAFGCALKLTFAHSPKRQIRIEKCVCLHVTHKLHLVTCVSSSELQLRHLGLLKLPKDPHPTRWRASCPLHIMSSLTQDLACCWKQAEGTLFTHRRKCLHTTSISRSQTTRDRRDDSQSPAPRQAGGSGAPYPPVSEEDTASTVRHLDGEADTCGKSSV